MFNCGFKIQLIWILSLFLCSNAYYFNNGYLAVSESREEPSTGNYNFEYSENHDNSNSYRRETRKGNRVTGEYGMRLPDGRMRVVKYIADENGYRTIVDSNEPGYRNQNTNNYHNEFERLTEIKALQQQQLKEQQQLLEKQILLQQQVQEEEIKKQENYLRKTNNDVENYETPLPAQNWSKQKQIENYNRASQQWILNQKKHLKQQEEAKKEAEERQNQLFIQEQIRQQQLVLQQQLWLAKEKNLKKRMEKFQQEKSLNENRLANQKINLEVFESNYAVKNEKNRIEENSFDQNQVHNEFNINEKLIDDQKNSKQTSQFKKDHQWWNKEEKKIDTKDFEVSLENQNTKQAVTQTITENKNLNKENINLNEESERINRESQRKNEESLRLVEEAQRKDQEIQRKNEENLRQLKEKQRRDEENQRRDEENQRRIEEKQRRDEENQRRIEEKQRRDQENQRRIEEIQRKNEENLRQLEEIEKRNEENLRISEEKRDFYRESNQNAINNKLQDYSTKNIVKIRVDKNQDSEKRLSWKNFSRIQRLRSNGKTSIRKKVSLESSTKSNEIERESLPTTKKIETTSINTTTIISNIKQDDQSTTTVPTTSTTTISTTTPFVNTTDLNNLTEKEQSTTEKISSDFANSP